jgi:prepilin-type processing-associated H-X9-DG protein
VFLFDSAGAPDTDAQALFADGSVEEPDLNGMIAIPASRAGQEVSIRRRSTRHEICVLFVPIPTAQAIRIGTENQVGRQCQ